MAEEESGFTFVDKRKTAATVEPEAEPSATAEPEPTVMFDDAGEGGDDAAAQAPSVYDLLQYIVQLLAAEAWHKMGLVANPTTGVATVDLPQARAAIDTVSDIVARLEAAPEGAVEPAARRDLRNILNDLRLNFVNQRQSAGSSES